MTTTTFFAVLAMVVLVAGFAARRQVNRKVGADEKPVVDDEAVRRIAEEGRLSLEEKEEEEPLDLREIEEEERRFWNESWDEPEEF